MVSLSNHEGRSRLPLIVIAGLDPAIHGSARAGSAMDARVKPAHDSEVWNG